MIITVGAEKGGVGKSRLATHIATLAACEGVDVVLLDTDKQGSSTSWTRIRAEEGVTPPVSVVVLPASPSRELLSLAGRFDLVVVDIGAQNYKTFIECAILSDLVLVPCGPDQQEIESTQNVFAALADIGPRHRLGRIPAHVVLTRISTMGNAKATSELREFFSEEGIRVFDSALPFRTTWYTSGKAGRAVHELKGKDRSEKAVAEMAAVYEEIKATLSQEAK